VCFERLSRIAASRGIRGWEAHAHLGKANLLYFTGRFEEAKNELLTAERIYQIINQKWGIINSKLLYHRISFSDGSEKRDSLYKELFKVKELSEYMNYKLYSRVASDYLKGNIDGEIHLSFL
jgi:hypothetical protein